MSRFAHFKFVFTVLVVMVLLGALAFVGITATTTPASAATPGFAVVSDTAGAAYTYGHQFAGNDLSVAALSAKITQAATFIAQPAYQDTGGTHWAMAPTTVSGVPDTVVNFTITTSGRENTVATAQTSQGTQVTFMMLVLTFAAALIILLAFARRRTAYDFGSGPGHGYFRTGLHGLTAGGATLFHRLFPLHHQRQHKGVQTQPVTKTHLRS